MAINPRLLPIAPGIHACVCLARRFEYLGTRDRLVLTPLTTCALFHLSRALRAQQGSLIAAPWHRGKWDTVQALADLCGTACFQLGVMSDVTGRRTMQYDMRARPHRLRVRG